MAAARLWVPLYRSRKWTLNGSIELRLYEPGIESAVFEAVRESVTEVALGSAAFMRA